LAPSYWLPQGRLEAIKTGNCDQRNGSKRRFTGVSKKGNQLIREQDRYRSIL
jgi:hypothetical protein